jgi:HAD superfamily hydrolase (TIGR01549 family)
MTLKTLQAILWDYDGVLMDSNSTRDRGFLEVLKNYPASQVEALMDFHRNNGGLSRYVKFRYFFEIIRKEAITDSEIQKLAASFSEIMRSLLVDTSLLIAPTLRFVKKNYQNIPMYIVSGSDQEELRFLCKKMNIHKYFREIYGSPKPKTQLVKELLTNNQYIGNTCLLIGDSINDYDAAFNNGVQFMAYNNALIKDRTTFSIALD